MIEIQRHTSDLAQGTTTTEQNFKSRKAKGRMKGGPSGALLADELSKGGVS